MTAQTGNDFDVLNDGMINQLQYISSWTITWWSKGIIDIQNNSDESKKGIMFHGKANPKILPNLKFFLQKYR
jgi:hypothetical protein